MVTVMLKHVFGWLLFLCVFATTALAQESDNYTLGPGDTIVIQVFGQEDMKIETQ